MADPQTQQTQASAFDVDAARKAGYSDDEIIQHLAASRHFDVDGALKAGYQKSDIIGHLSGSNPAPAKPNNPAAGDIGESDPATGMVFRESSAPPVPAAVDEAGRKKVTRAFLPAAGAILAPFAAPAAGIVGGSLLAGGGAGAGTVAGQIATGQNPAAVESLKETGKNAAVTTVGSLLIGGGLAGISKLLAPAEAAAPVAADAMSPAGWQKINSVLGVKPSAIRIGEQATGIEQAATNPGRTLAKVGLDADTLSAMTPIQRQAAIAPRLNQAGQAIRAAIQDSTDAGTTLDIGKSTTEVLRSIKSPAAQQQAIDALSTIQHELGIENLREATPIEAKEFRDALKYGARFNTGGDLSSLGSLRANLYRAASRDLEGAVPNLDKLNEAYSDLKGGIGAARNAVAKAAVTEPEPPLPTKIEAAKQILKEEAPRYLIRGGLSALGAGGVGGAGYGAYRALKEMTSP